MKGERMQGEQAEQGYADWRNVGDNERRLSLLGGALASILGLRRGGPLGMLMAGLGAVFMYRGATGHCALYQRLGRSTATPHDKGLLGRASGAALRLRASVTINRDRGEVYAYWRDFSNLVRFMRFIEEVRPAPDGRSHWVAEVPMAGRLEWESEITADEPDQRIAWRSVEGSEIETSGEVRFRSSPYGTEVEVEMSYQPPGTAGAIAARLARSLTQAMLREDLRRFKRLMESGELPSAAISQ
ncbi:MAG: DUF2892 domain-containing protein [Xanthomonadaceae bacterium]|nr:DUF2892 domain-containing protein [Xanthomonadaceae bacterium]